MKYAKYTMNSYCMFDANMHGTGGCECQKWMCTIPTKRTTEHVWHGWTCIVWFVRMNSYTKYTMNSYCMFDARHKWVCMSGMNVYLSTIPTMRTTEHVWHGWTCMSDGAGIAFFHRFSLPPSHTSPLASSSSYFSGKIYFVMFLVLVMWPMFW